MMKQDRINALRAPFPAEALKPDTSRRFELTSIKAAYVIERLNEVFGPCGTGWRSAHSPFEHVGADEGRVEAVTEVACRYRVADWGWGRITWADGWQDGTDTAWSEPIFAGGGKGLGKGGAPYADARKSAVTDGLTRAASMIGVGHEVFRGLVRTNRRKGNGGQRANPSEANVAPSPTSFWSLYHEEAKPFGVPESKARPLSPPELVAHPAL